MSDTFNHALDAHEQCWDDDCGWPHEPDDGRGNIYTRKSDKDALIPYKILLETEKALLLENDAKEVAWIAKSCTKTVRGQIYTWHNILAELDFQENTYRKASNTITADLGDKTRALLIKLGKR